MNKVYKKVIMVPGFEIFSNPTISLLELAKKIYKLPQDFYVLVISNAYNADAKLIFYTTTRKNAPNYCKKLDGLCIKL